MHAMACVGSCWRRQGDGARARPTARRGGDSTPEQRGLQPDPMLAALGSARRLLHRRCAGVCYTTRRSYMESPPMDAGDGGRGGNLGVEGWRDGARGVGPLVWLRPGHRPTVGRLVGATVVAYSGFAFRRRGQEASHGGAGQTQRAREDDRREREDWDERHTHTSTRKLRRLQGGNHREPEEENIGST